MQNPTVHVEPDTRTRILEGAIGVFGRLGIRKTTVDDLASAAGLSKPALYHHFAGKEEIYVGAIERYLETGLATVEQALTTGRPSPRRLTDALEAWFGRHKDTFADGVFDVFTAGNRLTERISRRAEGRFKALLARAIADAPEFQGTPREAADMAEVLYVCGLSWKEYGLTREALSRRLRLCVRVCFGRGRNG